MEGQTQTDVCFSGKLFLILKEPAEYSPQTKSDPLLGLEVELYRKQLWLLVHVLSKADFAAELSSTAETF